MTLFWVLDLLTWNRTKMYRWHSHLLIGIIKRTFYFNARGQVRDLPEISMHLGKLKLSSNENTMLVALSNEPISICYTFWNRSIAQDILKVVLVSQLGKGKNWEKLKWFTEEKNLIYVCMFACKYGQENGLLYVQKS